MKSKNKAKIVMYGDMCIVGRTVDNNIIVYDRYTNDTRVVQLGILNDLKERNKIVNRCIDLNQLSMYNNYGNRLEIDRGLYIIGSLIQDGKLVGYRVFGSGAKPVDIQVERLLKRDRKYINASLVGDRLEITYGGEQDSTKK